MPCKFPDFKPLTGWRKGCRCKRCGPARRKAVASPTRFEDRSPAMKARYPVPVGPILELLEGWLERVSADAEAPSEALARELGLKDQSSGMRLMCRYRNGETTYISFEMADKIVSTLYGPHYWYQTPELYAIYEECA